MILPRHRSIGIRRLVGLRPVISLVVLSCTACVGQDRVAAVAERTGQAQSHNDTRRQAFARSLSDVQARRAAQYV